MVSVKEQKKIDGIKSSMHFLTDKGMGKHTVFVDSAKEVADFSAAEYFDTPEELTGARESVLRTNRFFFSLIRAPSYHSFFFASLPQWCQQIPRSRLQPC